MGCVHIHSQIKRPSSRSQQPPAPLNWLWTRRGCGRWQAALRRGGRASGTTTACAVPGQGPAGEGSKGEEKGGEGRRDDGSLRRPGQGTAVEGGRGWRRRTATAGDEVMNAPKGTERNGGGSFTALSLSRGNLVQHANTSTADGPWEASYVEKGKNEGKEQ